MSKRLFYKRIIKVTVLSEEPIQDMTLGELSYECMEGDLSGSLEIKETVVLNGKEAADALKEQGSSPEFFRIDEDGNDLDQKILEKRLKGN